MILRSLACFAVCLALAAPSVSAEETVLAPGVWKDLEMEDFGGRTWRPEDLLGRVVLLDFWATWCAPCLEELPNLRRIHDDLEGVVVLGISLDEASRARLRSFLLRHEVDWPQVHDGLGLGGRVAKRFGVEAVPRTVVVDGRGRLVAVGLRGEALFVLLRDLSRTLRR